MPFGRNEYLSNAGGGGGGIPGGLLGAPPGAGSDAAGRVPGTTNPIDAILGQMGGITGIQTGLTDNALALLRKQYPTEFFALQQQILQNAQRRAAGDISDLLPEMWQTNAQNAVGGGYSGSALENTKRLRDMGLRRNELELRAEESMKNVFGTTPTVHPQDMSGIIGAFINAQAQADMMRGAPNPEAAYQRAKAAARGGGGGGAGVPGVMPGRVTNAGGGASKVDDLLRKYGTGGFGPPVIASGTMQPQGVPQGMEPPDYGTVGAGPAPPPYTGPMGTPGPFGFGGSENYWGANPEYDFNAGAGTISDPFNQSWNYAGQPSGGALDFGGSLGYGGGADYWGGEPLGGYSGAGSYAGGDGSDEDYEWWL